MFCLKISPLMSVSMFFLFNVYMLTSFIFNSFVVIFFGYNAKSKFMIQKYHDKFCIKKINTR